MKMTIKSYAWLLLLICSYSYGQLDKYSYKRELKGVSEQWHSMILPNNIFGNISQDLSDIRIYGITAAKDTLEAPYLLRMLKEEVTIKEIAFKTINTSHTDKGYFFTFEIPTKESINQINLGFKQKNFDWQVRLEGSQNQIEWFTVVEDDRILSIKNELTDFQFTKLSFPSSKYLYYRLFIESTVKPELIGATIEQSEVSEGNYRSYTVHKFIAKQNKQFKQTEIEIELQSPVPLSKINFIIADTFDYYRPFTIKYLVDSFKTEQGWKYNYNTLTSGTLNSISGNDVTFKSTTLQKMKIIIHNQDNQALTLNSIEVKGEAHEIVARFTEPATYYLTYGNIHAKKPHYDIERFIENIPKHLKAIEISKELAIEKKNSPVIDPLFQNKNWLWAIMIGMILLLGWFSLKMMKNK